MTPTSCTVVCYLGEKAIFVLEKSLSFRRKKGAIFYNILFMLLVYLSFT